MICRLTCSASCSSWLLGWLMRPLGCTTIPFSPLGWPDADLRGRVDDGGLVRRLLASFLHRGTHGASFRVVVAGPRDGRCFAGSRQLAARSRLENRTEPSLC